MKKHVHHFAEVEEENVMERRRFTRFRTQDDAYAALRGNLTKVGKIYDISFNGLAFRYLAEKISNETFTHVDIFLSTNGFHLPDVPCTVVYDEKESKSNPNTISSFRCGLKFEPIKEDQQDKLEFFLDNFTTGILPS